MAKGRKPTFTDLTIGELKANGVKAGEKIPVNGAWTMQPPKDLEHYSLEELEKGIGDAAKKIPVQTKWLEDYKHKAIDEDPEKFKAFAMAKMVEEISIDKLKKKYGDEYLNSIEK